MNIFRVDVWRSNETRNVPIKLIESGDEQQNYKLILHWRSQGRLQERAITPLSSTWVFEWTAGGATLDLNYTKELRVGYRYSEWLANCLSLYFKDFL